MDATEDKYIKWVKSALEKQIYWFLSMTGLKFHMEK